VTQADTAQQVDSVERATLGVPGVVQLHGGSFGEVATYLPGRQVRGVRLGAERTEVHVVVRSDAPLTETATAVREAVGPIVSNPVDVFIEDVV